MSGLYNMMCGNNPLYVLLQAVLDTEGKLPEVPRWRDVYTTTADDGSPLIVIFARIGGNNRETYQSDIDALRWHPCYLRDQDWPTDDTYAEFFFRVPTAWQQRVLRFHQLFSQHDKGTTPTIKFQRAMAQIGGNTTATKGLTEPEAAEFADLVSSMADELGLMIAGENGPNTAATDG